MINKFINVQASDTNPKWKNMISRETPLYKRDNDMRSEFERDYTRIIHSTAYRRLKHKTQVFFSPNNDHICTRIEHVNYVESISHTIAKYLGLNTDLTRAISVAHDLGHSPFGHQGEKVLSEISKKDLGYSFWHEKNGLDLVSKIELLENSEDRLENLNLTYAVRDGIISHCGEIDENNLFSRNEFIDLNNYTKPNQYSPYTWEGCVVKISDKISYLGRDIEDAITLGILDKNLYDLYSILGYNQSTKINNTVIINDLISDLCSNSNPDSGLCFSNKGLETINAIKHFNVEHIYNNPKVISSINYFTLIINTIYELLKSMYSEMETDKKILSFSKIYPKLCNEFLCWICKYWNINNQLDYQQKLKNTKIFDIKNKKDYYQAIIYFISGMTDNFAIDMYNEIIGFF